MAVDAGRPHTLEGNVPKGNSFDRRTSGYAALTIDAVPQGNELICRDILGARRYTRAAAYECRNQHENSYRRLPLANPR